MYSTSGLWFYMRDHWCNMRGHSPIEKYHLGERWNRILPSATINLIPVLMTATLTNLPSSSQGNISRTPSLVSGLDAFGLSNQAQSLARTGDLAGAERLHLQALDVKTKGFGFQSLQVASTLHALAEVQIRLGRPADAEQNLRSAISIRSSSTKEYDLVETAKSRELLAQVLESTGNLAGAKNVRLTGQRDWIACGNSKVEFIRPEFRQNPTNLTR